MPARVKRETPDAAQGPVSLLLAQLRLDPAIQPRVTLSSTTLDDYTTLYQEADAEDADVLPPLEVFQLGEDYYLADGFHRYHAAKDAGRDRLPCQVHHGTQQEAIRFAALANLKRGLPYSRQDREQVLDRLLADPEVSQRSDRQLATLLGLSHMTVNRARHQRAHVATLTAEFQQHQTTCTTPQRTSVAAFLDLPEASASVLARHQRLESAAIVDRVATAMANEGLSVQDAKAQVARSLTRQADTLTREAERRGAAVGFSKEARAAEKTRRHEVWLYDRLMELLEASKLHLPPDSDDEGASRHGIPSAVDLVAGATAYCERQRDTREAHEHILTALQRAYQFLDEVKAACQGQGWDVNF